MDDVTTCFGLPLLVAGQGQKDVTHNEAIMLVDALLAQTVESVSCLAPPADPVGGQCWLVPASSEQQWGFPAGTLMIATQGGWRTLRPPVGYTTFVRDAGVQWRCDTASGAPAKLAVASVHLLAPTGGDLVDVQARLAIDGIINSLRVIGIAS